MPLLDVLQLGPIQFDAFSTPDVMTAGGRQAMTVHKLPGGARVIDLLGPDPTDIIWRGQFFNNNAMAMALQLDALCKQGNVLPLRFAGTHLNVVIAAFLYSVRRFPLWVDYAITCTVVTAPPSTSPAASVIDNQVGSDTQQGNDVSKSGTNWGDGPQPESGTSGGTTNPPVPFLTP
jgi:hypothetical protein